MSCRCSNGFNPACPIDHASVQQRIDALREALYAHPKFRDDALGSLGCDKICDATDADDMWRRLRETCEQYANERIALFPRRTEEEALQRECEDYGIDPYVGRKAA